MQTLRVLLPACCIHDGSLFLHHCEYYPETAQDVSFDVEKEYKLAIEQNLRPKTVIEKSVLQHAYMCIENSELLPEARTLARLLEPDIEYRMKQYAKFLTRTTKNYREWLVEDYKEKLAVMIGKLYRKYAFED